MEYVWARRPEPHSVPETLGTRCDNCPDLSCIPQEKSKLRKWRYFCESRHETIEDIWNVKKKDCPRGRDLPRRRMK